MAVDTYIAYVGVYPSVADAESDYQLVKDLHTEAGMLDAYDAAVIEKRDNGKVHITKKHETPIRAGGVLGGGVGLATGLVVALFPAAAIGGGLLAATTAGGAVLGAVSGHAAAGMSRKDLKELGESLDEGRRGLSLWESLRWKTTSSRRWATRRRSRPASCRPIPTRSNKTPRPLEASRPPRTDASSRFTRFG